MRTEANIMPIKDILRKEARMVWPYLSERERWWHQESVWDGGGGRKGRGQPK